MCWPQACLSDWAGYSPAVWIVTLGGAVGVTVLACVPFAAVFWISNHLGRDRRSARARRPIRDADRP